MESNWRFNVWFYGLNATRFRFFARSSVNSNLLISDWPDDVSLVGVWFKPTVPGQLPTLFALGPKLAPHFPYGYPVLAD